METDPTSIAKFARIPGTITRPPPINVRYFYAASVSIDDAYGLVPPPAPSGSSAKLPPRPFSVQDNALLDKAWIESNAFLQKSDKNGEEPREQKLQIRQRGDSPSVNHQNRSDQATALKAEACERERRQGSHHSPEEDYRSSVSRRSSGSGDDSRARDRIGHVRVASKLRDPMSMSGTDSGEQGLTGMPFVRAPSREASKSRETQQRNETGLDSKGNDQSHVPVPRSTSFCVPVGASRLHQVTMPVLQLEPIYWNPVNDVAAMARCTWFYQDTMLPVATEVANMLEYGYLDTEPWTQTWTDELNSAVEAGAAGEEKIAHSLWPDNPRKINPGRPTTTLSPEDQEDGLESPERYRESLVDAATAKIDESATGLDFDNKASGESFSGIGLQHNLYLKSKVIYANKTEAYILRQALQPSAYYGRRPFANYIRKGHSIGIKVLRGFNEQAWNSIHPPPSRPGLKRAILSESTPAPTQDKVTDLILVIHGIGQKLSERMESFHFTHAMNSFRREINVELVGPAVRPFLRAAGGGIQVLPVNWRETLTFEDEGSQKGPDGSAENQYGLPDITPESLPSIRSIISDVMLDIPYYLSHHQPRIISAVIKEANRIFELWCLNNPGFENNGRVHIIAHSLGSVMSFEILSRQPTSVKSSEPHDDTEHFTFDTRNLIICGSPAGFFLLLRKANLIPRRGRKAQETTDDPKMSIYGEQGTYGCLAVDNIYNIVNPYDPVAYRINAAVDAAYANSLKQAYLPSAASSWFAFSNPFKTTPTHNVLTARPKLAQQRLPSNVELETHDFTREDVAEKKFSLLNEYGQIDWFVKYGGGPLEIQYLTMLGAHSSYWTSQDFVRFVVLECARRSGKESTLPAMRAVKKNRSYVV